MGQRARELTIGTVMAGATTMLSLFVAELALRGFAPVADPYAAYKVRAPAVNRFIRSEFPRNFRLRTSTEDGLPGMAGAKMFTTNNMGFRGDSLAHPKPPGELRLFLVGGSTAECLYLDDSESLDRIVQLHLEAALPEPVGVRVYNSGKSGDASDDHISMLVHRIVHLHPDVVVVFAGANDLTRSIVGADPLHYVAQDSGSAVWGVTEQLRFLATESQVLRRTYYLVRPMVQRSPQAVVEEITSRSDYRDKVSLRKAAPVTESGPRLDTASYGRNLRTIAGVAKAHGVRLVFMTQQSTWNGPDPSIREWHWILYRDGVTYREEHMDRALGAMNDVMRAVAAELGMPLYDLARTLPKSSEYFYDDMHFNVQGARVAGTGLADFLVRTGVLEPSASLPVTSAASGPNAAPRASVAPSASER